MDARRGEAELSGCNPARTASITVCGERQNQSYTVWTWDCICRASYGGGIQ